MKTQSSFKENESVDNSLIKDIFKDMTAYRKHSKIHSIFHYIVIMLLIGVIFALSWHNQKLLKEQSDLYNKRIVQLSESYNQKMIDLLNETEFVTEYTIDTDNNSQNNGYINVNK